MPLAAITKAVVLLDARDTAGAVAELVAAWTKLPSIKIAVLTHALSERLPRESLPTKPREREARWHAIAKQRDRAQLPTLLDVEWPAHPREARARVEALLAFSPDPRVGIALMKLWNELRYVSSAGIVMWRIALRGLLRWRDPLAGAIIEGAGAVKQGNHEYIVKIFARTKLPAEPKLPAEVLTALRPISANVHAARPRRTHTTALREAVYDDPTSDGPRLVLADALLANGDPYGEFIQLQLAPASTKTASRIASLLRAHERGWNGDFERLIGLPKYRRGFIAEGTVDGTRAFEPERREWCTVEAIAFLRPPERKHDAAVTAFLMHCNLDGLRRVIGVPVPALEQIARTYDSLLVTPPLVSTRTKTRARTLGIGETYIAGISIADILAWFDKSPFQDIEELVLERFESDLPVAWTWFQRAPVPKLTMRPRFVADQPMAWEIAIDKRGAIAATWWGKLYGEREPTGLGAALAALPANAVTSLTVRAGVRVEPALEKQLIKDIRNGLKRHPKLRDIPVRLMR